MLLKRFIIMAIVLFVTILFTLLSEAKDCQKAREYFEKAANLGESVSDLFKKEQFYKEAIRLCPSYAAAHNNLGDVYERQGRFEEAIAQYKKTIEVAPSAPYPYFGLGDIYYKTSRYDEARRWYDEGLKHNPNDKLTRERLTFIKDIQKEGLIKASTIRGILTTTRGTGEIVSITFGEGMIPFDFDSANIRPDAVAQLDELGKALNDAFASYDASVIEIAGHADIRGTDEYNLDLSDRRANAVVNYLVKNFNIPKDGLSPRGYGERVPICTESTELCHALNRRVVITKKGTPKTRSGKTRDVSYSHTTELALAMDVGFFYQRAGQNRVEVLCEGSRLRSLSDKYFVFFRPHQDCYTYIVREDPRGKVNFLFPQGDTQAFVKKDNDYCIPGFGKAYALDDTIGEESLYLIATSWPLKSEIESISMEEVARSAVRSLKTRIIKVIRPSGGSGPIQAVELNKKPSKIQDLLKRVEGYGGWVKVVRFWHE